MAHLQRCWDSQDIANKLSEENCRQQKLERCDMLKEMIDFMPPDASSIFCICKGLKKILKTEEEVKLILEKGFKALENVKLDQVESVIYELLLLAFTKSTALRCLTGICDFFSSLEREPQETRAQKKMLEVEGLVLRHIMYAAKRCRDVGKAFAKSIQNLSDVTRFQAAIVLSLAHIPRYRDQMFGALKSVVMTYLKDKERLKKSKWARSHQLRELKMEEIFKDVIKDGKQGGFEYAVESACEFGFILLNSHLSNVQVVAGKIVSDPLNPSHGACTLGKSILMMCFESHFGVRCMIFERVVTGVLNNPISGLYFIDLVKFVMTIGPQVIQQRTDKVVELIDRLSDLPHDLSGPLIKALLPIVKLIPTLRDQLVAALRKTAFSRDMEHRKVSVVGFYQVLKTLNSIRSLSSSQLSQSARSFASQVLNCSTTGVFGQPSVDALNVEVVGCLRRALTHQAEVRQTLYLGLAEVTGKNPSLMCPIVSLLLGHFSVYFEESPEQPPLRTSQWVKVTDPDVVLAEPMKAKSVTSENNNLNNTTVMWNESDLPDVEVEENEEEKSVMKKCFSLLSVLSERMSHAQLEDFGLDKSADYSGNSIEGLKSVTVAFEMLSVLEVLMEFAWKTTDFTVAKSEILLHLYGLHAKLTGVLKEKAVSNVKKATVQNGASQSGVKVTAAVVRAESSSFSLEFFHFIFQRLLLDQHPTKHAALALLRKNADFVLFVVDCAVKNCHHLNQGPSDWDLKHLDFLFGIGRLMLLYWGGDKTVLEEMKRAELKSLLPQSVELLSVVYSVTNIWAPERFKEMLDVTMPQFKTELSVSKKIFRQAKLYLRQIWNQDVRGERGEQLKSNRQATLCLGITSVLVDRLSVDEEMLRKFYKDVVLSQCENNREEDVGVAKSLFKLLISLERQIVADGGLAVRVAENLRSKLRDAENADTTESEIDNPLAIISEKTAPPLMVLYTTMIEQQLSDVSWLLLKLRASLLPGKKGKDTGANDPPANYNGIHNAISLWLTDISKSLEVAVLCDLSLPVSYDLARTIVKYFNTVTSVAKYFLLSAQNHRTVNTRPQFETLITRIGNQLTKAVSAFIVNLQTNENDETKKFGKKTGTALKAKMNRESKPRAELVLSMEQLSLMLVRLSKKLKVHLVFKSFSNVGYKLTDGEIQKAVEEAEEEGDEETQTPEVLGGDHEGTPAAKGKRSKGRKRPTEESQEPTTSTAAAKGKRAKVAKKK